MRCSVSFVCGALLVPSCFGQPPFPLESLKVTGNRTIAAEKIVAASGMKLGARVSKPDFDAARNRLIATGAFENVGYEFKPSSDNAGYDAVFDVAEVEQLFPYRFEDLPASADALKAALRKEEPILGERIPATKQVLDRFAAAIQRAAGDKVKVTAKVVADVPGEPVIVFRPNTPRAQIAEVRFTGNDVLPAALLTRSLGDVAIGTGYSEAPFRLMLEASIRPLYEARGRVRVAFPKIEVKPSDMVDGVVVTVSVSEGASYSLGSVRFVNASEDAQKAANLQSRDIANFDEIKAGLDRLYGRYRSRGYLHATGKVDRHIDDQQHRVDLTVTVEPGPQFVMGKLEIAGLDLISEPAIRKVWDLKPGAPFQPEYPDAFLNDIRAQGVFDNLGKTKAETSIDENRHVVDVKLYFSGAGPEPKKKRGGIQ